MSPDEVILAGVADMLQTPERDFQKEPLTQEEVMSLVENLQRDVNNPETDEQVSQYFIHVIEFLKKQINYH